jgi:hypothetical protein
LFVSGEQALSPRRFDFASQTPEEFEELCFDVVRLQFPNAVRLGAPDHGLDCLVGTPEGAADRGWQAKRFTGNISWSQCRQSLERAITRHNPRHVTFCFARDLTAQQHELFARNLAAAHTERTIDYWGASELAARLNTEEGRLVARRFFGDPRGDADRLARAVRGGGSLDTVEDVLERQSALGEHLAGQDPYFFYQTSVRESDAPDTPPAPGTAVSLERLREGIVARIDVQPRTPDALVAHGPAGRLIFPDDDDGQRALEEFQRLRERGGQLELDRGIRIAFDRLPPGLASAVRDYDDPMGGKVIVTQRGAGALDVIVRARKDTEVVAEFALSLEPDGMRGADGEAVVRGRFGGLEVAIRLWPPDSSKGASLTWRYASDRSPAAQQRDALRFVTAVTHGAIVEVASSDDGRVVMSMRADETERDPWVEQMLHLFETLVHVEAMNGIVFDVPPEFDESTVRTLLEARRMLTDRGAAVSWRDFTLVIRPEALSKLVSGGPLFITEEVEAHILGRDVRIGRRELEFTEYRVGSTEPLGDDADADLRVTFVPADGESQTIWMRLVPADDPDVFQSSSESRDNTR